ncbi:hypothetical protein QQF73_06315 [Marinobacter sp. M216]|uniref:Uncharacterized protein n=1 Tax=Marinobacter albus TaxID=3030833 RepID=A0ABT7HA50_9GAMM|nr:hypothetical protein [Marinobacter sp. M216]MDK9557238.1 hypothetical protein [Marinobacter sp. M216]
MLPNHRNSIVFTGFQAPGTRGNALVNGEKFGWDAEVPELFEEVDIWEQNSHSCIRILAKHDFFIRLFDLPPRAGTENS